MAVQNFGHLCLGALYALRNDVCSKNGWYYYSSRHLLDGLFEFCAYVRVYHRAR